MINSFNEYQQLAGQTDIIKPEVRGAYYSLGLNGEVGEVVEKICFFTSGALRDKEEYKPLIALELGDVMWYVARMAAWLKAEINVILDYDNVQEFQMDVSKETCEDYVNHYIFCMHQLSMHAGKVADCMKKVIRDSDNIITREKRIDIIVSLAMITHSIAFLSEWLSYPLSQILQMNIDKLASRKERGKIGGSGDNR